MNSARARVKCFISTSTDPFVNLAIENSLLRAPSLADSMILLMWRNSECVIIGRNQNPWTECNLRAMHDLGVPLVRRQSGGGTVYHDTGNTNYSIMMPRQNFDMRSSAEIVARSLRQLDIPAQVNKRNDITVNDLKVSGSAYRVLQKRAFHHGTMLMHSNLERLRACLSTSTAASSQEPSGYQVDTRAIGSVRSRVTNLSAYSLTVDHLTYCQSLVLEFLRHHGFARGDSVQSFEDICPGVHYELVDDGYLPAEVEETVDELKSWQWMYGLTPDFEFKCSSRDISASFHVHRGLVTKCSLIDTSHGDNQDEMLDRLAHSLVGQRFSRNSLESMRGDPSVREIVTWLSDT
eukprot:Partr_v1_DN25127_c0_g1_i2_m76967 putative Lipoate-protein ligase